VKCVVQNKKNQLRDANTHRKINEGEAGKQTTEANNTHGDRPRGNASAEQTHQEEEETHPAELPKPIRNNRTRTAPSTKLRNSRSREEKEHSTNTSIKSVLVVEPSTQDEQITLKTSIPSENKLCDVDDKSQEHVYLKTLKITGFKSYRQYMFAEFIYCF
jgi:hypothetical protein